VILLGFALAGCGERETRIPVDGGNGENVTLRSGNLVKPPANLPEFTPLYPGARIESVLEGNGSAGRQGGMVAFRTSDSTDKVAAYYRARLDASGLGERNDINLNGALMLTAGATEDVDRGVQVSIAPIPDSPGSYVTLTYNLGEG
jgi:hypothetical protein